ncbi:hypothetical protein [Streptococcus intermedius]|nr:hypothetical protein [Streptococcus intermedius]RSJ19218.1 hypothetical protein D8829_08000 [Streptococcus intermedius]
MKILILLTIILPVLGGCGQKKETKSKASNRLIASYQFSRMLKNK